MRPNFARLTEDSPIALPCGVVVVLLLVWVQSGGAQAMTSWAPGALLIVALLAVAFLSNADWRCAPKWVRVATVALAAFTAWSFLSILWAGDQGEAWEGANRTLLFLAVFALFALWRQSATGGSALLGAWTLGMIALALLTLLRISGAADPATLFVEDRLSDPAGYPNAAACMWMMALWPAIAMAANKRLHFALRGVLAAGAVVLVEVALLSLSRGATFALPVAAIVFLACFPDRLRNFGFAIPVVGAAALAAPAVLDVGPAMLSRAGAATEVDTMVVRVLTCALLAGGLVAVAAWYETGRGVTSEQAALIRRVVTALAIVSLVAIVVAGAVRVGNPVDRINSGWDSFTAGYAEHQEGSRLASGLGSGRYDFYRVSLDLFKDQPLHGVGVDNFFIEYLDRGRTGETPRYPHSIELRIAAQTGIVGVLLMLTFLGAAIAAVADATRVRDPAVRAIATGATMVFGYWLIHGSVDWFWEFTGLAAPAFAFLGLACGLAPRTQQVNAPAPARTGARWAFLAVLAVAAVSIALPWLSEREVQRAADIYDTRPLQAYDRLERAARLNPLSDRPELVAGSIALRYSDLDRADARFADALKRVPDDQYATLMRGVIASERGDRDALGLLEHAARLAPRDRLTKDVLAAARDGRRIQVAEVTRAIFDQASVFGSR